MNKSYIIFTWVLTVLAVIFGVYLFINNPKKVDVVVDTTNLNFVDASSGISFVYPKEFSISAENTLIIPKSFQPKTNFSEAKFSVLKSSNKQDVDSCYLVTNGEVSSGFVEINGISFLKTMLGDAGAGNFYETTSYRTVQNNICFNISYVIHSTNIGVYSPDQGISEFDKGLIVSILEKVAKSVKLP